MLISIDCYTSVSGTFHNELNTSVNCNFAIEIFLRMQVPTFSSELVSALRILICTFEAYFSTVVAEKIASCASKIPLGSERTGGVRAGIPLAASAAGQAWPDYPRSKLAAVAPGHAVPVCDVRCHRILGWQQAPSEFR